MQGNIAEIAMSLQLAKGTPAATAQYRMRLASGSLPIVRDVADIQETTGDVLLDSTFVAHVHLEGTPAFVARPNFAALLSYAALGSKSSTGASDPYLHTMTMAAAPFNLPWLTVWCMLSNGMMVRATDCKVAVLKYESSTGGLLMATATIIGKTIAYRDAAAWATEVTTPIPNPETANPLIHGDAAGAIQIEGVPVSAIERVMVEINNGAAAQYGDNITPDDITQALRTINVETAENIVDFSMWNRLHFGNATPTSGDAPTRNIMELGGSPAGLQVIWQRPGTPARAIQINVPRLQLVELGGLEPNTSGDPIKRQAKYRAFRPASGSPITILHRNNVAAYTGL